MTRKYQNVSQDEFEEALRSIVKFEEAKVEGTKEVVYDCPLPDEDLTIRIYSTLERGRSRSKGSDAIRLVIFDHKNETVIGGRKKTLRLAPSSSNPEGWKGNLVPKLQELYKNWRNWNKTCSRCGNRMRVVEPSRSDEWTRFWSCTQYPACENTENYND